MSIVYMQFKRRPKLENLNQISLGDLVNISAPGDLKNKLQKVIVDTGRAGGKGQNKEMIFDGLLILRLMQEEFPSIDIRFIGETYTIVELIRKDHPLVRLFLPFIWILLFIGSAMTIMNFHHDVGMQEVQQKIHFMFTSKESQYPLWIQIPYSFGLGIGMILFFNYWFTKRFSKEPSPLEIELYKYEQDIDQYKHQEAADEDSPPS